MIPKIIHYCWFGDKPIPKTDQICIDSWKKFFPDFELKLWNEDTFHEKNEFLDRMIQEKKWGLYSEYVRFWAIEKYGGVYFDTDIEVLKPMDTFLNDSFFLGFEKPGQVNIAVIGSEPNHPFSKMMLKYYEDFKFNDQMKWSVQITGPILTEMVNIEGKNEKVEFMPNAFIYPIDVFYSLPYEEADTVDKKKYLTSNSYAIHYWNATWVDAWSLLWAGRKRTGWSVILKTLMRKPIQTKEFYKNLLFHLKCTLIGYPKK